MFNFVIENSKHTKYTKSTTWDKKEEIMCKIIEFHVHNKDKVKYCIISFFFSINDIHFIMILEEVHSRISQLI